MDRCSGFGRVFLIIRSPEDCERSVLTSFRCLQRHCPGRFSAAVWHAGAAARSRHRRWMRRRHAPVVIPLQRNSSFACISPSVCLSPYHDFLVPRPATYLLTTSKNCVRVGSPHKVRRASAGTLRSATLDTAR